MVTLDGDALRREALLRAVLVAAGRAGDIRLALKFRLLEEKGKRPGLAFLFTNTFPTGNERKFLGTSHMVPGFELIAGKQLKYFDFAVNIGARFPQQKDVLGLTFNDQIVYGAAVNAGRHVRYRRAFRGIVRATARLPRRGARPFGDDQGPNRDGAG